MGGTSASPAFSRGNRIVRKPISKTVRFEVFKRDGFVCQYCGAHPPNAALEVDHIQPVSDGGGNQEGNLVTACFNCNRGKGARSLSSVPKSLSHRAAEASEREEQLRGYSAVMMEIRDRIEADAWAVAEKIQPGASDGWSAAWLESVKRFVEKIGVFECLDAADIARAKKPYSEAQRFRYFCGVCWRKIERTQ